MTTTPFADTLHAARADILAQLQRISEQLSRILAHLERLESK